MNFETLDISYVVGMLILFAWNIFQQMVIHNIKRNNEHQLHVHKVQFEKEFKIYNDVWAKIIAVKQTVRLLRPAMETIPPGKTKEDVWMQNLQDATSAINDLILATENNKPFYEINIYNSILELNTTTKREIITVQHKDAFLTDIKNRMQYYKDGEETIKKVEALADEVCEAIRNRIQNIKIA